MQTQWIPISEVQPGDRVKVPGFSSWSVWADRSEAETSEQPFREVAERINGWARPDLIRLAFNDGTACQLPPDAAVLVKVRAQKGAVWRT
jgi:hypothetical protein